MSSHNMTLETSAEDEKITREVKSQDESTNVLAVDAEAGVINETTKETRYSKLSVLLTIIFSGLAIGSDGFNASIIGNLSLILAIIYPDTLTSTMYSRLSNAFLIGMIVGMLGFGYISDKLGRKSGAILTTLILVIGIAMSAGASGTSDNGLFWMLVVSRGVAGVGAGGEYPISGPMAAEGTDEGAGYRKHRGFIFAMISDVSSSLGFVFGGLVPLLLLLCFHENEEHYDIVWRLSLALGLIPPLSIFWFRMRMATSTAYRKSSMKKQRVPYLLVVKKYWRQLLGVSGSWFIYNYIAYPFGLFASTILVEVNVGDSLVKNMGWGTLINCFYIPGAVIGGVMSDKIGRRKTMAIGFFLQACVGFILGGALGNIQPIIPLFIVLYGLFLTLGEVGPGATVLVVASESFPTSIRGQCMGLASAFSKAGAAIGLQVFKPILKSFGDNEYKGNQAVFLIGSGFAVIGALFAWFVIPDVDSKLASEDEIWKEYLKDNGYEIEWGDETTLDPRKVVKETLVS